MGIPSRHEPVDDDQPDDAALRASSPARADPLTAPLSELIADPRTGPLIHPKLAVPTPPAAEADEDAPSEERDEYADPVTEDALDDVEAGDRAQAGTADSPSDGEPEPGPTRNDVTVVDVDTEGFEPSAPLDVFAALREAPPAEPAPKKRRGRRHPRSSRREKSAPDPTALHDEHPDPTPEPEPEPEARSEPAAVDSRPFPSEVETQPIADAAVIGPALAAVLEAHDDDPDDPVTGHEPAASQVAAQAPPTKPTEQPSDDGPAYETLEELLNAVTARTHPPAPLRPVDDPPATLAWQPATEPTPEQPTPEQPTAPPEREPETTTPKDDPRRATAAEVARLLAPAVPPPPRAAEQAEPAAAPEAAPAGRAAVPETPPDPAPARPAPSPSTRSATAKEPTPAKQPTPTKEPPPRRADTVDVSARRSTQHLLLVLMLVGLVATAALGWTAWQEKSPTSIAVAVAAAVVTFIIWNAHSTAAPPQVVVDHGMLDIRTHDSHHRFDLASRHTRFDVIGTPGKRGWKVLIHRIGMAPYKLDASMVDPHALTAAMEPYRG